MSKSVQTISNFLCDKYELEPWHIELLKVVMLPKALRPHKSHLLRRFGICETTYYYWLRHPKFNAARREFVKEYYKDDIPDVLLAMKDEAIAGNAVAAKLFLEYVDDWNKDPASNDPALRAKQLNAGEFNVIINNLTQKFYGSAEVDGEIIEVDEEPKQLN